jgi:ParB/RepB/Spo0J family partition protein
MPSEQTSLLPSEAITPRFEQVETDHLVFTTQTISGVFKSSIERLGILQPLVVIGPVMGGTRENYAVVCGRRRATAAAALSLRTVPALVFPRGTPRGMAAAMAITENNHRRPNVLTDLLAIEDLLRRGFSERTISDELGVPIQTVKARLRLKQLPDILRAALDSTAISATLADRIVRLPSEEQTRLARQWRETGRLTIADVRAARTVSAETQLAMLDLSLPVGETVVDDVDQRQREDVVQPRGHPITFTNNVESITLDARTPDWDMVARVLEMLVDYMPLDDSFFADDVAAVLEQAQAIIAERRPNAAAS